MGLSGYLRLGLYDTGRLWVNGKLISGKLDHLFRHDITDAVRSGSIEIAMEVEGRPSPKKTLGPTGTLYLRKTPAPLKVMNLAGPWTRLDSWQKTGPQFKLPFKGRIFGLRIKVKIPKEWAGHPVRLQIDSPSSGQVEAVMVNTDGYFRTDDFSPYGPRIDAWLKPVEENLIELFGRGHMKSGPFNADLKAVRLAVYPIN